MTTSPKTAAQATGMIATLQAKRAGLVQTIGAGADRCRGLAVAAHLGDADAAEELREIETEEAAARGLLRNLDAAIAGIEQIREALVAKETTARESRESVELTSTIDELLELDDECDDALDRARDLLAKRDAFKAANTAILRRIPNKMLGAMLGREREVEMSLSAYFDKYLGGGGSYGAITRIAEFDSKYYGRRSPRMIERGPRPLSSFERTLRQAFAPRVAPTEVAIPRQANRR